jgi:hypothetical protein
LSFIHIGDDEELIVPGFPEIHSFDRSGIDYRGMFPVIQVLGFMDMTHGHIIQPGVSYHGLGKYKVFS